ncbi:hypothetical protein BaRGS_00024990, partial [Batillaria attramentaria]
TGGWTLRSPGVREKTRAWWAASFEDDPVGVSGGCPSGHFTSLSSNLLLGLSIVLPDLLLGLSIVLPDLLLGLSIVLPDLLLGLSIVLPDLLLGLSIVLPDLLLGLSIVLPDLLLGLSIVLPDLLLGLSIVLPDLLLGLSIVLPDLLLGLSIVLPDLLLGLSIVLRIVPGGTVPSYARDWVHPRRAVTIAPQSPTVGDVLDQETTPPDPCGGEGAVVRLPFLAAAR